MPFIRKEETENLIHEVRDTYGIDLQIFSTNILRFKLDRIMTDRYLRSTDYFIRRLTGERSFLRDTLRSVFKYDYELFREPELWSELRNIFETKKTSLPETPKILIPACSEFNELISMIIFLEEVNLRENSVLEVSWFMEVADPELLQNKNILKPGNTGIENLEMVFPEINFDKYFEQSADFLIPRASLNLNTGVIFHDLLFTSIDKKYDLIFFRDKLLNYNTVFQAVIVNNLTRCLDENGMIIFGPMENPDLSITKRTRIKTRNEYHNIYIKT